MGARYSQEERTARRRRPSRSTLEIPLIRLDLQGTEIRQQRNQRTGKSNTRLLMDRRKRQKCLLSFFGVISPLRQLFTSIVCFSFRFTPGYAALCTR